MKFFELIPSNTNFDFIGKFKIFVVLSIVSITATLVGVSQKGFNFGIDFTGGSMIQARFNEVTPIEDVRATLEKIGIEGASVVEMGASHHDFLITARNTDTTTNLDRKFVEAIGKDKLTIQQADVVGPKVGSELRASALRSLFYSMVLIMIYIWFRFDFRFAPGATVALIHDVIVASGFYLFTGREFTITAVAALLTIAGYSVNDTIVIYDRVRELMRVGGEKIDMKVTINRAINLTLSRTLLTSAFTALVVVPLILITEGEIQSFAMCMMVGLFVGSYSTIYVAAPMTIYTERYLNRNKAKAR